MKLSPQHIGIAALIAIVGLLAFNTVKSPVSDQNAWLESELANLSPDWQATSAADVNFQKSLSVINSKAILWDRLVAPPPPPKSVINVLEKLQGVQVTKQVMGSGNTLKIKMVTPSEPRGKWFGVGDQINGVEIREIGKDSVLFGVGEFTATLSR
jgi:hypothetical protein